MTVVSSRQLMRLAQRDKCAVGCMSVYNLESIQAVIAAAELEHAPVMLSIGNEAIGHVGLNALGCAAINAAEQASAPVTVHLNHGRSLDRILQALDMGFGSVMFDGSHLAFVENLVQTRRAAQLAHEVGAWVEGELGPLCGSVKGAEGTDLKELARTFIAETGVDLVAFSIPKGGLENQDIITTLSAELRTPLAIHGASRLGPDGAALMYRMGVAKINFHTEIKKAILKGFKSSGHKPGGSLEILSHVREAVTQVAREKLGSCGYSRRISGSTTG